MQSSIAAGDTLKATISLPDYPASSGWVLSYRMAPRAGGSVISFAATASGDDHQVNVAKAATSAWTAGAYTVAAWVDNGDERHEITSEAGEFTVRPNPATVTTGADPRSQAETALANVQTLLAGKASSGVMEYQINGRQLRSYPLPDLLKLEAKLKTDVDAERIAAGKPPIYGAGRVRRILTRIA